VGAWLAGDRKTGHLTLDLPDRDPVSNCFLVFVSNVDPWTYLGDRPIRTNPGTSPEGGLGVFAALSMRPPTVARMAVQLLRPRSRKGPHGGRLLRLDDVDELTITADEPVGLQLDGDFVGRWSPVQFRSVPNALRVLV
jgi:diacylglycerol kinase family enzyme